MGFPLLVLTLAAYVLGSIPSAVWVGRRFFGIDIRSQGSGNPGATNTFRVLGKKAGIVVLIMDTGKGAMAAMLARGFFPEGMPHLSVMELTLWLGLAAVLGHLFPVFLRFKGGKGVATLLGVVAVCHWQAALVCLFIFLLILLVFQFVSLASMLATSCFAVLIMWAPHFKRPDLALQIFAWVMVALVIISHRTNLQKLIKGEERKVYLLKSRGKV
jgi:acyl phosphate:glycerol-3-phosphate acyltransferase